MNFIKSSVLHYPPRQSASSKASSRPAFPLKALTVYLMISFATNGFALPLGGNVTAGAANISNGTASTTVTQSSQNAVINWQSFNIGQTETVQFLQPNSSSVTLNRVIGYDPSSILGSLNANGKVFLVNPNGILFGKSAQVNVGGLVASTLNISDSDFIAGNYNFAGSAKTTVVNQGVITTNTDGSYVALLGASVGNDGVISAKLGTVSLAAGNSVTLDVAGDGLLNVSVNQGAVNALVQNSGLVEADGGLVLLTAQAAGNLLTTVVNNTGHIQAHTIQNINGTIKLLADMQSGTVNVGGTLDVSGTGAGQTGGNITATGQHVGLFGGHINASGDAGGGTVLIGGDLHGANSAIPNASATYVSADSTINADAITNGNGGKVIVWANGVNRYNGNISARGGAQGGDGGFTEVSGKNNLVFAGYVDLLAPNGKTGTLLLDPLNLTIQAAAPNVNGTVGSDLNVAVNSPNIFFADYGALNSIITTGQVVTQLNTANVTLQATNDITVAAAIDASGNTAGKALTLQAGHDVIINAALTTASVGGGSMDLIAGNNVTVGAAITAAGGSVELSAGNNGTGTGTVTFGAVTAANLTIRFNPVSYTTTSAEIAAYAPKATLTGIFDARAWTFVDNTSATALSKPFDGTTAATLNTPFTFLNGPDGHTAGQVVSLSAGSANFNTAHVVGSSTVTFTGYSLSAGGDSADYALFAQPANQSQTITTAPLTATANITGVSKTFDGLLAATGSTVSGSTSGEVGTDSVALDTSGLFLNFSDAHVAGGKTIGATGSVALSTLTSTGSGAHDGSNTSNRVVSAASDYTLAAQPVISSVIGTINAAPLTATATITGASKTYDGLLAATGSTVVGSTSGEIGTDTVSLDTSGLVLNFSNVHVVPAKTIGATGNVALGTLTSSGSGNHSGTAGNLVVSAASDYVLAAQPVISNVIGTINPAALNFSGTRVYDATLNFAANTFGTTGTITTGVGLENLLLTGFGTVPLKGVAAGTQTLNTAGLILNNGTGLASDYTFSSGTHIATITPAPLAISGITASNKVYDGNTGATVLTSATVYAGLVSGDAVSVNSTGVFSDKNVANGKTVILTNLYSGADVSNYTIANQPFTTANITAAPLGITILPTTGTLSPISAKPFTQSSIFQFVPVLPIIAVPAINVELHWLPTIALAETFTDQSYARQSPKKSIAGKFNTWHGSSKLRIEAKVETNPTTSQSPTIKVLLADSSTSTQESDKVVHAVVNRNVIGSPLDGGKFAKLKIGMTIKQVEELIGAPDWTWQQYTGTESTPYYTGTDPWLVQYTYKSEGMLTFNLSQERVLIRMLVNRAG